METSSLARLASRVVDVEEVATNGNYAYLSASITLDPMSYTTSAEHNTSRA